MPVETTVETLVHELLHVADWSKDEDWIEDTGRFIAKALMASGLLKEEQDA